MSMGAICLKLLLINRYGEVLQRSDLPAWLGLPTSGRDLFVQCSQIHWPLGDEHACCVLLGNVGGHVTAKLVSLVKEVCATRSIRKRVVDRFYRRRKRAAGIAFQEVHCSLSWCGHDRGGVHKGSRSRLFSASLGDHSSTVGVSRQHDRTFNPIQQTPEIRSVDRHS